MKKGKFKKNSIKNFCCAILLLFLFMPALILSQEVVKVNITLKLIIKEGDLKNSQITITKMGVPYKVIEPGQEINVFDLPLGTEFTFTLTKIGYNTKRVLINTNVPANREKGTFAKHIFEVVLEKKIGKLEDNYIQLLGKFSYSAAKGDFDKDYPSPSDKNQKTEPAITQNKKITPNNISNSIANSSAPIKNKTPISKEINNSSKDINQTGNKPEIYSNKPMIKSKEEKIIQEDYRKLTIITIKIDEKVYVFIKEQYNWGTYYYKDGKNITESTFLFETQ